jgi:hypothetical protein
MHGDTEFITTGFTHVSPMRTLPDAALVRELAPSGGVTDRG